MLQVSWNSCKLIGDVRWAGQDLLLVDLTCRSRCCADVSCECVVLLRRFGVAMWEQCSQRRVTDIPNQHRVRVITVKICNPHKFRRRLVRTGEDPEVLVPQFWIAEDVGFRTASMTLSITVRSPVICNKNNYAMNITLNIQIHTHSHTHTHKII